MFAKPLINQIQGLEP